MDSTLLTAVTRAREGDREAFEDLIRRFSRAVYAQVWGLVRDPAEAEDLVQATFLKAWRSLGSLEEPKAFPGWLMKIAGNLARDASRRHRPDPLPEGLSAEAPALLSRMEGREMKDEIRQALASLPDGQRQALTLRYLEGLDYRAIEHCMGITNGTLRGMLGRGLGVLRRRLRSFAPAGGQEG